MKRQWGRKKPFRGPTTGTDRVEELAQQIKKLADEIAVSIQAIREKESTR